MFFCPPQAEKFVNLRHTSDDFPLENRVSEGQINCKCQKIACGALATTRCIVKMIFIYAMQSDFTMGRL